MIVWFIGLSGSGKTTLARLLVERLRRDAPNVALVDGDVLREVWGDSPGHDVEGRRVNARRLSHLCRFLDSQEIHAVAAVLSIFPEWQAWNREHFSRYFEVFLDTPMETVEARDSKGLYRAARNGAIRNVVGVDIPFPRPTDPDLVLSPPEVLAPPEEIVERIMAALPPLIR